MPSDTREDETQKKKTWAGNHWQYNRVHNLHRKKLIQMSFMRWKQHLQMVHFKPSSPKPLQLVEVTISLVGLWLGLVGWGFFGRSAWAIRASFTHRHRSQVLTVLWDRTELHANNTTHNFLKSKENYLCSGCSPYSHPASCLNDEKFQQTTDSKQPSAETEQENGDLYQWETKKAMSTPRAPEHHPLPSHCTHRRGQPSWAHPRDSWNPKYQHLFLRDLHEFRGGNW